jgi:hypothetical protein
MRYVKHLRVIFSPEFKLVTSNKRKLREYKEYIPELTAKEGEDLPEVLSDDVTVAIYKGLDNGPLLYQKTLH